MQFFAKLKKIFIITKPSFYAKGEYCINTRLCGGEDNTLTRNTRTTDYCILLLINIIPHPQFTYQYFDVPYF